MRRSLLLARLSRLSRPRLAVALALVAAVVFGAGGAATWSAFSSGTSNAGNSFSAAASFQTLDHFVIEPVGERHSGKSFVVTVRAKDASGATVTSFNGTVGFSVNSGSIAPSTSNSFVDGVLTQAVTVTGSYTQNQTISVTGGSPAKSATSNAFTLHDWRYYFTKATANTGTNCGTAFRKRDMEEGYAGADPGETHTRGSGGSEIFNLCSPTFAAGDTLAAGTSTVSAHVNNTAGSGCGITATLFKNGATSLGSVYRSIPQNTSAVTLFTWSINSSATTFAAGDRLVLQLKLDAVKACASTDIHYGGTTYRSRVDLPGPGGSAYSDAVLGTSGLNSFWRLNETSGTTATDSKGTTHGTYTGGVSLGAAGALPSDSDKAAGFDGLDDFLEVGDFYDFAGTAASSVEFWFKKDVSSTTDWIRLVDKHKTSAPRDGWVFALDPGTQKILFERWGSGTQNSFASSTATETGRWYHVVGTYDGTNMRLYVNGELEATRASSVSIGNTTVPLRVARSADAASYFDGTVDEVAIYGAALSSAQVKSHYDAR